MVKKIGSLVNLGFGKETTRGTVVNPTVWMPKLECDFQDKFEQYVDEASFGTILDSANAKIAKQWSEGTIGGHVGTETLHLILYALFGAVSSAQIATSGVYTHSFTVAGTSNQHPSLSIHTIGGISDKKYALCMLESFKITIEAGKGVKISTKWKGKKGVSSSASPSYVADYLLMARTLTFKKAANLAGLGAASASKIRKFELEINKNLEDTQLVGDGTGIELDDITNDLFTIKGSIEAVYEDEASFLDDALAGTMKAFRVTLEDTDINIGSSGTNHPKLNFDLAKVSYTEQARNMDNGKIMAQTLGFKGHYSMSDAQAIVASLQNVTTSI